MRREAYNEMALPNKPGVYFFKRGDDILYIGKATNIKQRTGSYFSPSLMEQRGPLIVKMVEDADQISFQETDSVLEALILESNLIKRHKPPYNSKEKDDRSYNYVIITDEEYPRVFMLRKRQLDIMLGKQEKLLYQFGPFPQESLLREALSIIRKIFPFYGKRGRGSYAQEFYHQLGLQPGNDGSTKKEEYHHQIKYVAQFFQGKKQDIIKQLKERMHAYADDLAFERAASIKYQIKALEHIKDVALMKRDFDLGTRKNFRMEAYDIAHMQGEAMVGVMVVHEGGAINNQEHRVFNIQSTAKADDTKALYEVVTRRFKHPEWPFPHVIIVDGGVAQQRVVQKTIREQSLTIPVIAVVKDERHKARSLIGQKKYIEKYKDDIIALNNESHRFAIRKYRDKHHKNFLN
jgi:excinuclease ABC subunit C